MDSANLLFYNTLPFRRTPRKPLPMSLLQQAKFFTTVAHLRDLPRGVEVEVAFAGRSNAGKSSAINTLANHVRLAFVSKTPGRTQNLNYFEVAENNYLVDLPGYGYAKAPEEVRLAWEGLIAPYLAQRQPLVGIVLIMDSRHPLTPLDVQMLDFFVPTGKAIHVLLTKADKLSRQEQSDALRTVNKALAAYGPQCSAQLFSSLKKTGVEQAEAVLARWFGVDALQGPPLRPKPPAKAGNKKVAAAKPTHRPGQQKPAKKKERPR